MKIKLLLLIIFFGAFSLASYSAEPTSSLPSRGASEQTTKKRTVSHVRVRKSKSKKPLAKGRTPRKSKESRKGRSVNIF